MFEKFRKTPLMYWSLELLIIATLLWVCTKIDFLFSPIGTFISTVFMPLILATFLYYMLHPLVNLLMKVHYKKFRITRTWAVVLVFVGFLLLIVWGISSFLPSLINQISQMLGNLPMIAKKLQVAIPQMVDHSWLRKVDFDPYLKNLNSEIGQYAEQFLANMTNSIGNIIAALTNITVIVITVPIILFYMLKDGYKLIPTISRIVPEHNRKNVLDLFYSMSDTLSSYISGQVIECIFVGTFTVIGYMIIHQPYGLVLGVVAGICNIIPYVGPYFGIFPSLLVAIAQSPEQVISVIIVVLIVQQVDGNLIYPNVIGKSLQIHPLTIIILLLVAGKLAGILGMILAVPTYAIVKVLINFIHHIWVLDREKIEEKVKPEK
ncbi:AI-2E family transporter [Pediococcus acidilactici]